MTAAQVIEEPAAVLEPTVGHSIPGLQASDRDAGGQGAGSVVQGQLVSRVPPVDRPLLVQVFAQAEYGCGDGEALGLVCVK